MDVQKEIQSHFRQFQEKYTYYIIALCVTSIGFSVYKTTGTALKLSHILLGLAVSSWGISIYCGLTFLKYIMSNLFANNAYFEILEGRNQKVGNHPQMIQATIKGVQSAMESNSEKASKYSSWQDRLFYIGVVLFLIWHILEMYLLTIES